MLILIQTFFEIIRNDEIYTENKFFNYFITIILAQAGCLVHQKWGVNAKHLSQRGVQWPWVSALGLSPGSQPQVSAVSMPCYQTAVIGFHM